MRRQSIEREGHSLATTRKQLRSQDGTRISVEIKGQGPPLILIDGALSYVGASVNDSLSEAVAGDYTVFTYDRRGRGESDDPAPYAVEREIEDLESVIELAGGSARVYGISSGAALALRAAASGAAIDVLAIYEAPFVVDKSREPIPGDFRERLAEYIDAGRRGAAVHYFMTRGVGMPAMLVGTMRLMPAWRRLKAVAHTLPYDAAILGDNGSGAPLRQEQWASVGIPTLVVAGSKSPAWTQSAMRALAQALPNARYQTLEGQMHIVKASALAPVLLDFLATTTERAGAVRP